MPKRSTLAGVLNTWRIAMFGMLVSLLVLLAIGYFAFAVVSEIYVALKTRAMEADVIESLKGNVRR
jgi:hypothetical protein